MEKKKKQWRVIAQPIVTLVFRDPVTADTPLEAVETALEKVNLYDLFQGLSESVQGAALLESDFAEGHDAFIVDPIGDDGEPDVDNCVRLNGDGEPADTYQPHPPYWLPEGALQVALNIAQAVLADERTLDYVRAWTAGLRDVDTDPLRRPQDILCEARKEIGASLARASTSKN